MPCPCLAPVMALEMPWTWPWTWYASSLVLAALALLTKPVTVTLPLVLVLYELCLTRKDDPIRWKEIIPFFLLSGLLAVATYWAQTAEVMHYVGDSFLLSLLLTVKVVILYLGKLILPIGLSSRYVFSVSKVSDIFTPSFFLCAALLLLFLGGLVFLWLRAKEESGFSRLLVSDYSPACGQHYSHQHPDGGPVYVSPLSGLWPGCRAYRSGLHRVGTIRHNQGHNQGSIRDAIRGTIGEQSGAQSGTQSRQRGMLLQAVCILLVGGVVVLYGSLTLARNRVWRDDRSLWEDALAQDPNNYWAATFLANTYMLEAQKSPGPSNQRREPATGQGALSAGGPAIASVCSCPAWNGQRSA